MDATKKDIRIVALVPTIGRSTLQKALDSLNAQTRKPDDIIVKNNFDDTVTKITSMLKNVDSDYVVICDDDAIYPREWIQSLLDGFTDESISFCAGACRPMSDMDGYIANDAEKCIAEVTTSWMGTMNMSQRYKIGGRIKDRDETNLMGSGMYRTDVLKRLYSKPELIPPAFSETYSINAMRQWGYKTLYIPNGFFFHKTRSNLISFARQIFRCGVGRTQFFKQHKDQLANKFYIILPAIFVGYLGLFALIDAFVFWFPIEIPLLAYITLILIASFGFNRHKSYFMPFYYMTLHISYGLGQIIGLFKEIRTWK